jgi:hypothetical protein
LALFRGVGSGWRVWVWKVGVVVLWSLLNVIIMGSC